MSTLLTARRATGTSSMRVKNCGEKRDKAKPGKRMSWFTRRRLGRNLDKLEDVMESAAQEVLKMWETGGDDEGRRFHPR